MKRLFAPLAALSIACVACGGPARPAASAADVQPGGAPQPQHVDVRAARTIVTKDFTITEPELAHRAELAILTHRWREAANDYALLVASGPGKEELRGYLMNLALAYEGSDDRAKARDAYLRLADEFPDTHDARTALVRAATLDAYLQDWRGCGAIAERIFARKDIDDIDRVVALGARALAKIEQSEPDLVAADRDVLDGLDLSKTMHFANANVLPVAIAQLRFALGEVRRMRSEEVRLDNVPLDQFAATFDERSELLLSAEQSYDEAVHSVDPHWAMMAGLRDAEMWARIHRDLMAVPAPPQFDTPHQKDVFYAFIHIRFRGVLEKGIDMVNATIGLADRLHDTSDWVARAKQTKSEMEDALADEKDRLAKMPFTEEQVNKQIEQMAEDVRKEEQSKQTPR